MGYHAHDPVTTLVNRAIGEKPKVRYDHRKRGKTSEGTRRKIQKNVNLLSQ